MKKRWIDRNGGGIAGRRPLQSCRCHRSPLTYLQTVEEFSEYEEVQAASLEENLGFFFRQSLGVCYGSAGEFIGNQVT